MCWEDETPECLVLKVRGTYFQETQRPVEKKDPTLKGGGVHTKFHMLWDTGKQQ